mgnify:CR=1 FL=1
MNKDTLKSDRSDTEEARLVPVDEVAVRMFADICRRNRTHDDVSRVVGDLRDIKFCRG